MTGYLKLLFAIFNVVILAFVYQSDVLAHGFGERYDLPLPLWLYVSGGGIVVFSSFLAIGFFLQNREIISHYPTKKIVGILNGSRRIQQGMLGILG